MSLELRGATPSPVSLYTFMPSLILTTVPVLTGQLSLSADLAPESPPSTFSRSWYTWTDLMWCPVMWRHTHLRGRLKDSKLL